MEHRDLFEKIKETSNQATVQPTNDVWAKLEQRLDADKSTEEPPSRFKKLFTLGRLSIAASILLVIGAYTALNFLGKSPDTTTAIQLENLHTLEVNPRYNIPVAGESATIPSVRAIRATPVIYQADIKEGSADKKLVPRIIYKEENKEFGLG